VSGETRVLVVANETLASEALAEAVRRRAEAGPIRVVVVAPVKDVLAQEGYDELIVSTHPEAERRLREALAELRADGIDAHGQVAHPDPYAAAMNVVGDERVDELIVSTFPGERSGGLRRDVVGRLRADAGVPVQHVVVETEAGVPA
jgi:hypothetical protein